jgi:hypothetical protein
VHAYGGPKILSRAGLTDEQVSAIQEAQELRSAGDFMAARDKLVEAGITEDTLKSIRDAAREARSAMRQALEDGDYAAFKAAVADSPLGDIITSEADFEQFREAHELRLAGEWAEANDILDGLGINVDEKEGYKKVHHYQRFLTAITDEQREALRVARQANDRATIQAIFDEAGVEPRPHRGW